MNRLVPRRLLDPREAAEAAALPIADAVNIPLSELPHRTYELPPKERVIRVVGPDALVKETVRWLQEYGRRAVAEKDFHYAASCPAEVGRLWEPNAFLSEVLPELAVGTALDLACGSGRDAVYLSSCGWEVTGVDLLPNTLQNARELAQRCAPAIRPIQWQQIDLEAEDLNFNRRFDLITIFFYLHRPLLKRVADWLAPGGSLLVETFTTLHRERHGKPGRDRFVLQPGELPTLVEGLTIRHYSEDWRGERHTARLWATSD